MIKLFGEPRVDIRPGKMLTVRFADPAMNVKQLQAHIDHTVEGEGRGVAYTHTTEHVADAFEDLARQLRSL